MLPRIETEDGDFEFTTEFEGCTHCDLCRICMKGRRLYNSRAWICELLAPGKGGCFKHVEPVLKTNLKEEKREDAIHF